MERNGPNKPSKPNQSAIQPPAPHISPFEAIRKTNEYGQEYWSSRDISKLLGYLNHRNFESVIEKAETACENSGNEVLDHFAHSRTMIRIGKGESNRVVTICDQ